jgi:hypothetical protein
MKGLELLIVALAAFYILGLIAGIILVYAISAIRIYRAAKRRRRLERERQETVDRRQWYAEPPPSEGGGPGWPEPWDDRPPSPREGDEGPPPPRWPSA